MSDWTQRPLDQVQIYYAALDAYATRGIFLKSAYLILNNVGASQVKENMENYAKTREFEGKSQKTFRYRVTCSESLHRYLSTITMNCQDYGL